MNTFTCVIRKETLRLKYLLLFLFVCNEIQIRPDMHISCPSVHCVDNSTYIIIIILILNPNKQNFYGNVQDSSCPTFLPSVHVPCKCNSYTATMYTVQEFSIKSWYHMSISQIGNRSTIFGVRNDCTMCMSVWHVQSDLDLTFIDL